MAEKKTEDKTDQINVQLDKAEEINKMTTEKGTNTEKPGAVAVPIAATAPAPRPIPTPLFTKVPPNDLYRKLLPAALFLLTFVTVMTLLLIYMDSVALGAQQFRLNMSRDYELDIPQDSPVFLNYIRQKIPTPKDEVYDEPIPEIDDSVKALDSVFGADYVGSFAEILPEGARLPGGLFLQRARRWRPLLVRAAPRDYLAARAAPKLHACLAAAARPREIAYQEPAAAAASFSSRVLCAPLYSILAAAGRTRLDLAVLPPAAPAALAAAPPAALRINVIQIMDSDPASRAAAAAALRPLGYRPLAARPAWVMYRADNLTLAGDAGDTGAGDTGAGDTRAAPQGMDDVGETPERSTDVAADP